MTFSIVARDAETGDLGVAVASKFLAVGSVVPWARAGIGAVATQAWANVSYGPRGLALMAEGIDPAAIAERLTSSDDASDERQFGLVDACRARRHVHGSELPAVGRWPDVGRRRDPGQHPR